MTTPTDIPVPQPSLRFGRRGWFIVAGVAILVLIGSLRTIATIWTDQMWFSSAKLGEVWWSLLRVKAGLFFSFGVVFFIGLLLNLYLADAIARRRGFVADDEGLRHLQTVVQPKSTRLFALIALIFGGFAGVGTISQWSNYLGFVHGAPTGTLDPMFNRDVSYYLFELPFYEFLVHWWVMSVAIIAVVVAGYYYLVGGITARGEHGRVRQPVKVHLSVLLALIAIGKAFGYVLQPMTLLSKQGGYVEGAGYTDVHARIPAMHLLLLVSIGAAIILLINIRQKGWALPVIAGGLWALVAVVVGVAYPAVLQAIKVTPNQGLEKPYIERNLEATRTAYSLKGITPEKFAGSGKPTPSDVAAATPSLANVRLWDPDPGITLKTFQNTQSLRSFYAFNSIGLDRYKIGSQLTPIDVGVRGLSPDLSNPTWVNTHLVYTHGNGAVLAASNAAKPDGQPIFGVSDVPSTSAKGYPTLTQPEIYFQEGQSGYVVGNTKQAELSYALPGGKQSSQHYTGTGGVPVGSIASRAALAIRLGDWNFLISGQITPKSRVIFVRNPVEMAEKAAPFLTIDSQPYAAIIDGRVTWMLDGYTTTTKYPYSQDAASRNFIIPTGSNLQGGFNYVRNSVKITVDAFSGAMTYYAWQPEDPLLKVYEASFPKLFTPASEMSAELLAHIRYPNDLFSVQAAVLGRYHIATASAFYNGQDSWNLSPTPGVGSYSLVVNNRAAAITMNGEVDRMAPIYQVQSHPNSAEQHFMATEAFVPSSASNKSSNLTGFLMVNADAGKDYGSMHLYVTPKNVNVYGPDQASNTMLTKPSVSQVFTLLDQKGSQVLLSNLLMIPVGDSILYIRPVYVTSANNIPLLRYTIAEMNGRVGFETSLSTAVSKVLLTPVPDIGSGNGAQPVPAQVTSLLAQANEAYVSAQAALRQGDLAAYQEAMAQVGSLVNQAQQLLKSVVATK